MDRSSRRAAAAAGAGAGVCGFSPQVTCIPLRSIIFCLAILIVITELPVCAFIIPDLKAEESSVNTTKYEATPLTNITSNHERTTERLLESEPLQLTSEIVTLPSNKTNGSNTLTTLEKISEGKPVELTSELNNLNDVIPTIISDQNNRTEIVTESYDSLDNVKLTALDMFSSPKTTTEDNNPITDITETFIQPPAVTGSVKKGDLIISSPYVDQQTTPATTNPSYVNKLNGSSEIFALTDSVTIITQMITTANEKNYTEELKPTETINNSEVQTSLTGYVNNDQETLFTTVTEYPSIVLNTGTIAETLNHFDQMSQSISHRDKLNITLIPDETYTEQSKVINLTVSPLDQASKATSKKIDMVISRRGGYIINTEATPLTSTEKNTSSTVHLDNVSTSQTEDKINAIEGIAKKNISVVGPHNRLMEEDAIKEELLAERIINDNQEYKKRYHSTTIPPSVTAPIPADEELNAKQSGDKKTNILYTVSPNYKPLKKIEVQPTKQFVRDPDDNSWRNESISSLGIVFKPKTPSKSFTQVLKNKTEVELSSGSEKDNKGETLDLRERLEKMAEERKSKKKRINKFGDIVYGDYEENSSENTSSQNMLTSTSPPTPFLSMFTDNYIKNNIKKEDEDFVYNNGPFTTKKPKSIFNVEYYDSSEEYDADYAKLVKMDIKKFALPAKTKMTSPVTTTSTTPLSNYVTGRQATVQYFPPTKKTTEKLKMSDYDINFRNKLQLYTVNEFPKDVSTPSHIPSSTPSQSTQYRVSETASTSPRTPTFKFDNNKYQFYPNEHIPDELDQFQLNDKEFNRGSYVIKHYRDIINAAVKDVDEDSAMGVTETPVRGVTIDELAKFTEKDGKIRDDDYDYDAHFRKDIINRFVDNFNQNSERFKMDFPILYNNSVIHQQLDERGKVLASSTAFLRRQYENERPRLSYVNNPRSCDPNCGNNASLVELSADYELHYYVPEQEEKEEVDSKPIADFFDNRPSHL